MFLQRLFHLVPKDPFFEAVDLINRGEFAGAMPRLSALLESRDTAIRAKARLYVCEAHLQLGDQIAAIDPAGALRHYAAASSLQPRFADLHYKVGEMNLRLGRIAEAEPAFRRALEINPRYFAARLSLAESLVGLRQDNLARHELERLEESCPPLYREKLHELRTACAQGAGQRLAANFAAIRQLMPTRLDAARDAAVAAIRRGEPEPAERILKDLVQEHPQFPDLHHLLGLCYGELGRLDEAVLEFQTALSINPTFLKARINLGITLMQQGQGEQARHELMRALEVDPANPLVESALTELAGTRVES
jgi:tetratricopeptide (TPR) repeat protein